jgi:hypothetical protein
MGLGPIHLHGADLAAYIHLALLAQYAILVYGQLGDGFIYLAGPTGHLGLLINPILLLDDVLDILCL